MTATVSLSPAGVTLNRAVMVTVESSSPDDFTVTPAMITFSDSDRSEDIIISASSDMVLEDPETHTVSLSFTDEDLNVQLSPATATVSITDNTSEFIPQYWYASPSVLSPPLSGDGWV